MEPVAVAMVEAGLLVRITGGQYGAPEDFEAEVDSKDKPEMTGYT